MDRHIGGVRDSHPFSSLNHFTWGMSFRFPLAIILLCLILSLYLVYVRVLPCVHVHLLAKIDSIKDVYG